MVPKKAHENTWLVHLLAWMIILGMPLFVTRPDMPMFSTVQYTHFTVMALSFMIIFYINYLYLISKFLLKKKVGLFILVNLGLILCMIFVVRTISFYLLPAPDIKFDRFRDNEVFRRMRFFNGVRFYFSNTILYLLVVSISVAIKAAGEWFKSESLRKEAEKNRSEAELQSLKSQLNPHFLFNTLNNIYSLIQIDQEKAQDAVHDLSRTLHYVLYESTSPTVPVKSEINFLNEYIALMRIRLPRQAEVSVSMPADDDPVMARDIAPMMFISLVENAFKHGVSGDRPSFINIDIHGLSGDGAEHDTSGGSGSGAGHSEHIVCDIRNSNFPKTDSDRSGSGIGIGNLIRMLAIQYPGRHTLEYGPKGDEYEARLDITL